jgi:hypothetical protein
MKARRLIDGASFGPETLKAVGEAFDKAWAQIASNFGGDAQSVEAARLKLAQAILSIANENSRDVEILKNAGLQCCPVDSRHKHRCERFARPGGHGVLAIRTSASRTTWAPMNIPT